MYVLTSYLKKVAILLSYSFFFCPCSWGHEYQTHGKRQKHLTNFGSWWYIVMKMRKKWLVANHNH